MNKFKPLIPFMVILTLSFSASLLFGAEVENSEKILTKLENQFMDNLEKWIDIIKDVAITLFLILAGLNLIIKIIMLLIEGADFQKTIATMTKFILVTAIFHYILLNGIGLASGVIESFIMLGEKGAGFKIQIESVLMLGWDIIGNSLSSIKGIGSIVSGIATIIISVATFVVLLLIVANFIVEKFSAWMMVYMGYFVLAFGGMDFTREASIAYIKAIIGAGLRLMTIYFMVGLAITNIQSLTVSSQVAVDTGSLIFAFTTSLLLLLLMQKLPDAVSALISGAWGHMSGINMATGMAMGAGALKLGSMAAKATVGSSNMTSGMVDGIKSGAKVGGSMPNNATDSGSSSIGVGSGGSSAGGSDKPAGGGSSASGSDKPAGGGSSAGGSDKPAGGGSSAGGSDKSTGGSGSTSGSDKPTGDSGSTSGSSSSSVVGSDKPAGNNDNAFVNMMKSRLEARKETTAYKVGYGVANKLAQSFIKASSPFNKSDNMSKKG